MSYADAISVSVQNATQIQSDTSTPVVGSVESYQRALVSTLEDGLVSQLLVEEGDKVIEGEVLLRLDSSLQVMQLQVASANLEAAKVDLQEARRQYDEAVELTKTKAVGKSELAQRLATKRVATANLAVARAEVQLQQEIIDRHSVKAPFSGTVEMRGVELGEWVMRGNGVFSLVNDNKLRVRLALPQERYYQTSQLLSESQESTRVLVQLDSGGTPLEGRLARLVPVSDENTRTFTALIDIPKRPDVMVGMSATVYISKDVNATRYSLPVSAVKRHPDGGMSVFAVENSRVKRVFVTDGQFEGDEFSFASLTEDSALTKSISTLQFVTSGVEILTDGAEVKIVPSVRQ